MRRSVARPRKMAVTAWLPSWGHGSGFGNSAVFVRQSQRMPRWSPTWPPGNTKTLEKSQGGQGGQPLSPRWSPRRSASALAGGRALTPTSQNLANWQTQFFFWTQPPSRCALTAPTEFANRGKLSGKLANSFRVSLVPENPWKRGNHHGASVNVAR